MMDNDYDHLLMLLVEARYEQERQEQERLDREIRAFIESARVERPFIENCSCDPALRDQLHFWSPTEAKRL